MWLRATGVAEMVRVTRPSGLVGAYAWGALGGGLPFEPIQVELRAMGLTRLMPPRPDASRLQAMHALWEDAGLVEVESREINVTRTYAGVDEFWTINLVGANLPLILKAKSAAGVARLKERLRARLPGDASGHITCVARANAVKGRLPAEARMKCVLQHAWSAPADWADPAGRAASLIPAPPIAAH